MSWGTVNAETRSGPLVRSTFSLASSELIPPIPVANTTPVSSLSTFPSMSESCQASVAAVSANWVDRSSRRACFAPSATDGSKSTHSPATLDGMGSGSTSVRGPTPERPAVIPSQYAFTPTPTGVTAPSPVTTTRRTLLAHRGLLGDHQVGRFADGLDAGDLVVRDLDAELLLEGEDDLDQVERVGVQVLLEAGVGRDLVRIDTELRGENLPHGADDLVTRLRHLVRSPSCCVSGCRHSTDSAVRCLPCSQRSRSHGHATVDRQDLSGDVAGLLAGQEAHRRGHVLGGAHATGRDRAQRRLGGLIAHGAGQLGRHVPRSDHVD